MKRIAIYGVLTLSAVVTLCVLLAGCATITQGTSQMVSITSNVEGATVYLDDMAIGKTPFQGLIKKGKKAIRVEMAGYRTETVALSKKTDGWFWGNLVTGGLVGSTTDGVSGAAYVYAPASYQVDLKSDTQSSLEFDRQYAVRKFSMIYIDNISRELATDNGEHIAALCELLGSRVEQSSKIDGIRAALEASSGDPVRFGDMVVDLI